MKRILGTVIMIAIFAAGLLSPAKAATGGLVDDAGCIVNRREDDAAQASLNAGTPPPTQTSGFHEVLGSVVGYATIGNRPAHISAFALQPIADVTITGVDGPPRLATYADALGLWSFWTQDQTGSLRSDYRSEEFNVHTIRGTGTEIVCNEAGVCYDTFRATLYDWNRPPLILGDINGTGPNEYTLAAANAYLHTKAAIAFIRGAWPRWQPPAGFRVNVNKNNQLDSCNAFFNTYNNSTNFVQAMGACPNTAFAPIVRHELGHGFVMTLATREGSSNDYWGFHEGAADALASLSLGTPCLGEDFRGAGCHRDLENDHHVFPVASGNAHTRGLPLAEAFWRLFRLLEARYGTASARWQAQQLFILAMRVNTVGLNHGVVDDTIAADRAISSGRNRDIILAAFEKHGLVPAARQ